MSRIIPGVYVGGIASASSKSQLAENNVTHICTVLHYEFHASTGKQTIFLADDSPSQDLSRYFKDACLFIHEARISGGGVLIHCACGVSRSVTITLAYLMVISGLPLCQLYKAIQGARPCAFPNLGFVRQLIEFETSHSLTDIRALIVTKFGEWPQSKLEEDLNELRAHMVSQDYFIKYGVYPHENQLQDSPTESDPSNSSLTIDASKQPATKYGFYTFPNRQRPRTFEEVLEILNSNSITSGSAVTDTST